MFANGAGTPTLEAEYRRAFPLVVAGATAASAGALYEIVFNPTRRSPSQQRTNGVERFAGISDPDSDLPSSSTFPRTGAVGLNCTTRRPARVAQGPGALTPITMSRLLDGNSGLDTTGLPAQPVVITHDDGHRRDASIRRDSRSTRSRPPPRFGPNTDAVVSRSDPHA